MSSTAEILRTACRANGLGTSGSSAVLLARMFNASAKKAAKTTVSKATKTRAPKKKNKGVSAKNVCKPKTQTPIKTVKNGNGATRLSASYYFHTLCNGKISRCEPHPIKQPNGQVRLKQIRIVNGAHGKHPRWVNVHE